jgi:Ca-activated chloride channel family protein
MRPNAPRWSPALALSALALTALGPLSANAADVGRVEGEVLSRATETRQASPLGGARVRIIGTTASTVSSAAGAFRIDQVPAGRHVVECDASAHTPRQVVVQVKADQTVKFQCVLDRRAVAPSPEPVAKAKRAGEVDDLFGSLDGSPPTSVESKRERSASRPAAGSVQGFGGFSLSGAGHGGGGVGYGQGAGAMGRASGEGRSYGVVNESLRRPSPPPRLALVAVPGPRHMPTPAASIAVQQPADASTEDYDRIVENDFVAARETPLSTFSIDVDTASYANVRRFLQGGTLPPPDAVRIEELVNYFHYDLPKPTGDVPFAVHGEVSDAPWNANRRLVKLAMQSRAIPVESLPPTNLVFLLDVSGSMNQPNKLPLLQESFRLLVDQLRPQDSVAITVYAGAAGVVLPPTSGNDKGRILAAIDQLRAGGSTAGAEGIRLAYQVARERFRKDGNNRVILATDGDFNVGVSSDGELVGLIEQERKSGVFLTVLGFGMGNYQDAKMQKLADAGNGNHAYIDSLKEARKVLVSEMGGTLFTVAKDVKLQVEFNPVRVKGYRLIGYENRRLADRDFDDDTKDAGELGAGHSVTAFYEIVPASSSEVVTGSAALKYQATAPTGAAESQELLTVKLRWKAPDGDKSTLTDFVVPDAPRPLAETSVDFRFAAAVVEFGLALRNSAHRGNARLEDAAARAALALGPDLEGLRKDFVTLAQSAAALRPTAQLAR